jgi:uncharacterized membrane protein
MIYIIEFFIFAFLGWILDSTYSSIKRKKLVISGYFKGLPFCSIYGFGGILLINNFAFLDSQPAWLVILITTILVVALEYVGGLFVEHFLGERLWDYFNERFNVIYISAWHSFLWLIVVSFSYFIFGRQADVSIAWLKEKIILDSNLEVLLVFVFLIGAFFLTMHNKKVRLAKLAKKKLEDLESLEEFFDFEKWQKLAVHRQKLLLDKWDDLGLIDKLKTWRQKDHD